LHISIILHRGVYTTIAHLILHISIILHRGVYTKHEGVVVKKDMDRENQSK
jgi:hypothetical protein